MKFHTRWFGLTCLAAALVACPTATTTSPTTQTINFTALTEKSVGDPAVTLTATASSGLAVSFSSLTTATCTVATGKVSPIAAGTCKVAADQAGNANFAAAPRAETSFNICNAVLLNTGQQTTWKLTRTTTGNAAYDPLDVVLKQTAGVLSGTGRDNNQEIDTSANGTVQGCAGNVALTLTLSNGGSARGVLILTGTISSAVNQPISGTYTSTGIQNNEAGTFTMTHN
jgi:hypothetical protein